MNVYIDESGDLGWSLDKPYRRGGSSRFLTIAFLVIPKEKSQKTKRIVKDLYKKRNQPANIELKGKDLAKGELRYFAKKTVNLIGRDPSISLFTITVKKENVQPHIRSDPNKLYNYMINLALLDRIKGYPVINFIPDIRTIKVKSGNSLVDYLQTKLWFEHNSMCMIKNCAQESNRALNLQFIDFVAHIVWSKHENNKSEPYNTLRSVLNRQRLFF